MIVILFEVSLIFAIIPIQSRHNELYLLVLSVYFTIFGLYALFSIWDIFNKTNTSTESEMETQENPIKLIDKELEMNKDIIDRIKVLIKDF